MPTEAAAARPVALFLFAHQDDEFGVFQKMLDELQQGSQVCCAYLTRGARAGQAASRRERESVAVLGRLGVTDIVFAGAELGIDDATLPLHLEKALRWIRDRLASYACIRSIYVPAWEGGHHDHDALHAVTVHAAERHDMLQRVRQFPLYSACWRAGPFFKVLQPLPANGPVTSEGISWHNRWRFLACCLRYPSQASSWLGLFPFVLLHYARHATQTTQPVSAARIRQRPHPGALYYERRGFFSWADLQARLACMVDADVPVRPA